MSWWRNLARPVRILILAILAAIVVVLLFTVVFPWVETYLENPTLGT